MKADRILKRMFVGCSVKATFWRALIVTGLAFFIFKYCFLPVSIQGKSMEPTYSSGFFNLINAVSYTFDDPVRFDIVAIQMAGSKVMLLKRVLALPGEEIAFKKGQLLIDGKRIPELHLKNKGNWQMKEIKVGNDEYFVAGDNRILPINQHVMGRVDKSKIIGRPLF